MIQVEPVGSVASGLRVGEGRMTILAGPEQRAMARPGRDIYQSRLSLGEPPGTYLVRVVVDVDRRPPEVVTAYRTSKIAKYWRPNE